MALSVEVAEIAEQFLWISEADSYALPPAKLARVREEVRDVLIYLLNLCDKLGVDPIEAARQKLAANAAKYPAEKVRGKSLK